MRMLILAMILFISNVFAEDKLDVRLSPERPVKGESFQVVFDIYTEDTSNPEIVFDPIGVEVLSRSNPSISTRTTYMNGQLTREQKISIAYDMVAAQSGSVSLRNIKVGFESGKELKHNGVRINILSAPTTPTQVFVQADLEKTDVYVGESIIVRYQLYNQVPVSDVEIRKFPKLENFLKRFHQENGAAERVRVNGQIYTRRTFYTTQLFATKPGKLKVDPIELNVKYSTGGGNSPFSGLGLGIGFGRVTSKLLRSEAIEVNVIPVPADKLPTTFTGLIGKHKIDFKINKTKFLVNEPIEIKISFTGRGALELYDLAGLLKSAHLEEFETRSDLEIKPDFSAMKTFDMTYLGRSAVTIPSQKLDFHFFDSAAKVFTSESVQIPELTIIGNGIPLASGKDDKQLDNSAQSVASVVETQVLSENKNYGPIYTFVNTYVYNSKLINQIIAFVIVLMLGVYILLQFRVFIERRTKLIMKIKTKELDYGDLYNMLFQLSEHGNLRSKIESSHLSQDAKTYFLSLVDFCEKEYQSGGKSKKIRVKKKFLKEFNKKLALR